MAQPSAKPPWLRVRAPGGERYHQLRDTLHGLGLNTVCEHARCPNVGTCWREGTATVMLLGGSCTRRCRFCAVGPGVPAGLVDREEPERVARAVAQIGLRYVVLTMVTRDDLPDGGAAVIADTVQRLRALRPDILVEALVSDFGGQQSAVQTVVDARPDVFAHNVEVVPSLTAHVRDPRCSYAQSLRVLEWAESDEQLVAALRDLRAVGVDLVTIGQYLRPTREHLPVERFVPPETFESYREQALGLGFAYVASGPLVRSSYRAAELYLESALGAGSRLGRAHPGAEAPVSAPGSAK